VSFAGTLCLVLMAAYGLASLLLTIALAGVWYSRLERRRAAARELFALRLLPSAGAAILTVTVVLPAFLIYEPIHESEQAGPLLLVLVLVAVAVVGHGISRGWRAYAAAAALLRVCGAPDRGALPGKPTVQLVDVQEPIVAVVGAWRPRILAARCVSLACDAEEFRQIVAHEAAHVASHDNLKLLLLLASPDALAWMPAGHALIARWRAAAELEADAAATGADPHKRVALASALIKVARLLTGVEFPALCMPVAFDDVQGRVRRLLAPPSRSPETLDEDWLMTGVLSIAVLAVPLYDRVQELLEAMVAFGR
jgi:Zn-dependent protease with chaperone function